MKHFHVAVSGCQSHCVGASAVQGLYLNTGHGTLGWTHGCGSGRAIAELISGRVPEVDFGFCGPLPQAPRLARPVAPVAATRAAATEAAVAAAREEWQRERAAEVAAAGPAAAQAAKAEAAAAEAAVAAAREEWRREGAAECDSVAVADVAAEAAAADAITDRLLKNIDGATSSSSELTQ